MRKKDSGLCRTIRNYMLIVRAGSLCQCFVVWQSALRIASFVGSLWLELDWFVILFVHALPCLQHPANMSDRRRDVRHSSRAPSRNNCRFSTNSRVSELHKVINHLRSDKGALAAQARRKRRQLDEADKDLRAAREKAEKNLEKMDDLILVEKNLANEVEKLTGENACLQEGLERAQQLQAEHARSKNEAIQAIVAAARSRLDDDPEEE